MSSEVDELYQGKRVYISGAIEKDLNFRRKFAFWTHLLTLAGMDAVNPVTLPDEKDCNCGDGGDRVNHTFNCYLIRDLKVLFECSYLFRIPDDYPSRGSDLEVYNAERLGIPVVSVRDLYGKGQL